MTAVRLTNETLSRLKEAFILFDYDKDGRISSRDIGSVIRAVGLKPSELEVVEIVDDVNKNDGGTVDLQTLVKLVSQKVTNPATEKAADLRDMFRVYDRDGTGTIKIAEMRHLLTTVGEKLTEDEADELLKMSGAVDRGVVNYEKFIYSVMGV